MYSHVFVDGIAAGQTCGCDEAYSLVFVDVREKEEC